jgi:hypothetical protein
LEKEELDRVGRPGKLQPAPAKRPRLDRRAVVIRNELAIHYASANPLALPGVAEQAEIGLDQIRRSAIDGHVIAGRPRPRPGDLGLVIAGGESRSPADHCRLEILPEKRNRIAIGP